MLPDWFPDWSDRVCVLVASGSSAKKEDVAKFRGRAVVFAVKQGIDLCPWADAVYGCDAPWWRFKLGLPNFKGLKVRYDKNSLPDYPDIKTVALKGIHVDRLQFDEPGVIGSGGNSGFQAFNLTLQFLARRIVLIGFDMNGEHYYGRNNWPMCNNPSQFNFPRWRAAFDGCADDLQGRGIEVVNCSLKSSIARFPRMTADAAVRHFGLQ